MTESKLPPGLHLSDAWKQKRIEALISPFFFSDEALHSVKRQLQQELAEGLSKPTISTVQDSTAASMSVTFFSELFSGTEKGHFVVVFVGRRHLILVLASIEPGFPPTTTREFFTVHESIRRSPYLMMFQFIAECMLGFLSRNGLLGTMQTVGMVTDLPIAQFGVRDAIFWYFTPSASNFPPNCYDVQRCFDIVLKKPRYSDVKIDIVCILSTSTATLVDASIKTGRVDFLLDSTDGLDVAYWEDAKNVSRLASRDDELREWDAEKHNEVLIDTGIRNFGGKGYLDSLATEWDLDVSCEPLNSVMVDEKVRIDKFISEKYLLELLKRILIHLHHESLYCREAGIGSLNQVGVTLTDVYNLLNREDSLSEDKPSKEDTTEVLPGEPIHGKSSRQDTKNLPFGGPIENTSPREDTNNPLSGVATQGTNSEKNPSSILSTQATFSNDGPSNPLPGGSIQDTPSKNDKKIPLPSGPMQVTPSEEDASDLRAREPIQDTRPEEGPSDPLPCEPIQDTHLKEGPSNQLPDEPIQDTHPKKSPSNPLPGKPIQDTHAKEDSSNPLPGKPIQDSRPEEGPSNPLLGEPIQETSYKDDTKNPLSCVPLQTHSNEDARNLLPGGPFQGIPSKDDIKVASFCFNAVFFRAARLAGVCLASIMLRSQRKELMVAMNWPSIFGIKNFERWVRDTVSSLAPGQKFQVLEASADSVVNGAAFATAIQARIQRGDMVGHDRDSVPLMPPPPFFFTTLHLP